MRRSIPSVVPNTPAPSSARPAAAHAPDWTVESWRTKLHAQQVVYADRAAVEAATTKLRSLPPLVTSWEIERLKAEIAQAQQGKRFILQGGDCAEQIVDCRAETITSKLKILLQMSVVLIYAGMKPVTRIGRIAGQYAKPRSSPTETRSIDGVQQTLPSYYGDLVNRPEFSAEARRPDPMRMVEGYTHAAMTLNFIRSLMEGGFADIHHPEYWNLGFMQHAGLTDDLRREYERMTERLAEGLKFMEAIGETSIEQLSRVEFFTSHEGLNLLYESALTRAVPRRTGWYNLSTHLPWLGERTRDLSGAHVEYFRGIQNPIGIKVGPKATGDDVAALVRLLNPAREPGKIVLIARMGAKNVAQALPRLIADIHARTDLGPVLWMCDPMHGNSTTTTDGTKTRSFAEISDELEASWDAHHAAGTILGGVHFEMTGEDVTECLGGARNLGENDLTRNYQSPCDPRLNYEQALELAFLLARKMQGERGKR